MKTKEQKNNRNEQLQKDMANIFKKCYSYAISENVKRAIKAKKEKTQLQKLNCKQL